MSIHKKINFALLFCTAVIAVVSSGSFAALTGTFGPAVPDFTETVTLDLSNDPTITGVKLTMTFNIYDGQFEFDNDSDIAGNVTIDLDAFAALSSIDVTVPVGSTAAVAYDKTLTLTANDGDNKRSFDTGGTDYQSINTGLNTVTFSWNVAAADVSDYVGSGTFDLDVDVSQVLNIIADSGIAINRIPVLAEGTVSVEYIPEPATIAILAIGGLVVKKRRYPRA